MTFNKRNARTLGKRGGEARAEKLDADELSKIGAKGGEFLWRGVTKAERSRRMKELIARRWAKKRAEK